MTLASLPTELLSIIFRNVFASQYSTCSSSSCYTCFRIGLNHVAWGPTQSFNPSDPTLFPFALAAVLPHWREVLSTVPEYWTRPVFFLDGATADIDVAEILMYSKNLPLEVYVTRRTFPHEGDIAGQEHAGGARVEARRMCEVMDKLKPHLSRCQYIFIHTLRSSSLPSLRHDFSSHCPFLTQLKLECNIDDGLNILVHDQHLPSEQFTCPVIYTLLIDGPNFREIVMKGHKTWWINAFKSVRTLRIQNLTATSGAPVQYVPALECISMSALPYLSTLVLSNVAFDNAPTARVNPGVPYYTFALNMLILSSMSFSFLSHFFQYSFLGDLYNIRLEACGTTQEDQTNTHIYTPLPTTFSLTLQNLSHPRHLIELLRTWNGRRLNLVSCPGFDDSVLEMMQEPLDSTTTLFGCPHLSVLYLSDCTNFTPAGLINMLYARNGTCEFDADNEVASAPATGPVIGGTGAGDGGVIELVTVTGNAPTLTNSERRDFEKINVIHWKSGSVEGDDEHAKT